MTVPAESRRRRLAEELVETGLPPDVAAFDVIVEETDHALRPVVHERRVPSTGTIIEPTAAAARWAEVTGLTIERAPIRDRAIDEARRFADGLSSWLMRRTSGDDEGVMFDRPAGSERDLVVLAAALGATIVQRHPSGTVRLVGAFGVLRTRGIDWQFEPPVSGWIDAVADADDSVLRALLEFAVHDLGAQGIGALLIHRLDDTPAPIVEERLPSPPTLDIRRPFHLAPLRHALAQLDGAAIFDASGALVQLGVRLVPSPAAESNVEPLGGTRHTSARRYSYDDPNAVVIAVSEDGPVTVLRNGEIVARSIDPSSVVDSPGQHP